MTINSRSVDACVVLFVLNVSPGCIPPVSTNEESETETGSEVVSPADSPAPAQPTTPGVQSGPSETEQLSSTSPEIDRLLEIGFMRPLLLQRADPNEGITQLSAHLRDVPFKDSDVQLLTVFPNLKWLSVSRTEITDAALPTIAGITTLEQLSIEDTEVTDEGVQHLAGLNLKELSLSGTKITNSTMQFVAENFPDLEVIRFARTLVNDEGLAHLHSLTKLRNVHADLTYVTDAGTAAFREALPECVIEADQ